MAIEFDYSRADRSLSLRGTAFRPARPASIAIFAAAITLALAAAPALAQYPGQVSTAAQSGPNLRSIAVLEWTGDAGHPKASRLIPLTVWDGQNLEDGTIYLARPEPLSLEGEVEYKLKQDGKTVGLYDIEDAAQEQGSWVGYGSWKALPVPKPPAPPKEFAQSDFSGSDDSGPPVLHRRTPASSNGSGSGSTNPDRPTLHRSDSSGSGSSTGSNTGSDSGSDQPTLHRKTDDSGSTGSSTQGSTQQGSGQDSDEPTLHRKTSDDDSADSADSNAPPIDPDRPILKEPARPTTPAKQNPQNDVAYAQPLAVISDPGRPRLMRGRPESSGPAVLPTLIGLPPDMHQTIAVSDAANHPDHLWDYTWANPGDAAAMKSDLEELARKDLGLIPPVPAAPTHKRTTSRRKVKPAPPPPPPAPLLDEHFRAFELTYGSGATIVFSARTQGEQKFITLIAQPDLYGNLTVLLKNTTDAAHLDDTPRMRLVDPVDAMADNRGELLFELRGATGRQFVLYRVLRGQIQKLFVSDEMALIGPVHR
ncbi:MAG: hypothetical protein ACRD27_08450 [Terracidiphilus sp.]